MSILTPTFNHERFIRRCLESAISQTDPRWEQIVVDDGSDDGTEASVRSVHDPRIRYVRMPHRGVRHLAASYNIALEMARGTFVAVLEGDDYWPADKLERQLRLFTDPAIVLSWGRAAVTNAIGEVLHFIPKPAVVFSMQGQTAGETVRQLLKGNAIPACTVMCRREALVLIGGFQQPAAMPTTDYPTWLELCRVGSFASSNEVLGFYRLHRDQVSVQMRAAMDRVMDWGPVFVKGLSAAERGALGLSINEAVQILRTRQAASRYAAARAALRDDDRTLARPLFRQALREGSLTTRLKASIGLGCALLGVDFVRLVGAVSPIVERHDQDPGWSMLDDADSAATGESASAGSAQNG